MLLLSLSDLMHYKIHVHILLCFEGYPKIDLPLRCAIKTHSPLRVISPGL